MPASRRSQTYIDLQPSSNFSFASMTTTAGAERHCRVRNKSKAWMDGERKYIRSLDSGGDILVFLARDVGSCYSVYIQSGEDRKEHFWAIYDDGANWVLEFPTEM